MIKSRNFSITPENVISNAVRDLLKVALRLIRRSLTAFEMTFFPGLIEKLPNLGMKKSNPTIESLLEIIERLEARIRELEQRLNKNSSNSSKPPSMVQTQYRQLAS